MIWGAENGNILRLLKYLRQMWWDFILLVAAQGRGDEIEKFKEKVVRLWRVKKIFWGKLEDSVVMHPIGEGIQKEEMNLGEEDGKPRWAWSLDVLSLSGLWAMYVWWQGKQCVLTNTAALFSVPCEVLKSLSLASNEVIPTVLTFLS